MTEISGVRAIETMKTLPMWEWVTDKNIKSYAQARPMIGDFFEEATRVLFACDRLKTEAGALCPDVQFRNGMIGEVKAIGRSRSCLIYSHRLRKYEKAELVDRLVYLFWLHRIEAKKVRSLSSLREQLASTVSMCLVIPAQRVHDVCWRRPERWENYSRYEGRSNWAKKPARRLGAGILRGWEQDAVIKLQVCLDVYGVRTGMVQIRGAVGRVL